MKTVGIDTDEECSNAFLELEAAMAVLSAIKALPNESRIGYMKEHNIDFTAQVELVGELWARFYELYRAKYETASDHD